MRIQTLFKLILISLVFQASAGEIVKWVDENGKVHYGDTVPDEYKDQSEVIQEDKVSVVSPEEEVRLQNKAHAEDIKNRNAREKHQEEFNRQREVDLERKNKEASQSQRVMTREECRDRYVKRTKALTECFRRAEEEAAKQQ